MNNEICEGDLFQLGNHKLLCGDSLKQSSYKTLLGKNKIDLVITDPPCNVDYSNKNKLLNKLDKGNRVQRPILNDVNIDENFFRKIYNNWKPHFNKYNSIYIYD